ncbi:hypothetical protein D9M71_431780 [compost metagenome]
MNSQVLHDYIIFPVLEAMTKYGAFAYNSPSARQLLLATFGQESHAGEYIKQVKGPALGIAQMEPATIADLYKNFATGSKKDTLYYFLSPAEIERPELIGVVGNLHYATALARMNYRRFPGSLPVMNDRAGMWAYYKKYWNSTLGAATEKDFNANWDRFVKGVDFSDPASRTKASFGAV